MSKHTLAAIFGIIAACALMAGCAAANASTPQVAPPANGIGPAASGGGAPADMPAFDLGMDEVEYLSKTYGCHLPTTST